MYPRMSNVLLVTFFGLLLNSLIVESLGTNQSEEDIYETNVCSGLSICNLTVRPRKGFYKCMCDSNCSFYGDCCPESVYHNLSTQLDGKRDAQSISCSEEFGFYMVSTCPPTFADKDIKRKCENVSLDQDFQMNMVRPVMEKISRITYSNAYCAQCNGANDFENFSFDYSCYQLSKTIEGKENLRKILKKAKLNPEFGSVTATVNLDTDVECYYTVVVPAHLQPYTRYCEPKMVSSCPETFNDSKVVEACHSQTYVVYTDPLFGYGKVYKNEYCARCNGVNVTNIFLCQNETIQFSPQSGSSSLFLIETRVLSTCDDPEVADLPVC